MGINKWSKEELDLIRAKYLEGTTISELTQYVDRTKNAIGKQLTRMGVRTKNRAWTTKEIHTLHSLFNMDVPYAAIAITLKRTRKSIQTQLRDLGLTRNKPWTPEDIEQLRQMRAEGIRYSDIAERLGRTYSTTVDAAKRFLKNDGQ